jgi:hypothetical protein
VALEDAERVNESQRRAERRSRFRSMGVFTG